MLVFLDESGDPGFKFDKGSSTHFVIALAIFDDPEQAENTANAIKGLKTRLGFHSKYEFKFNKCSTAIRTQFLQAIRDHSFRVRAMVVDKRSLRDDELISSKEYFYRYFVSELMMESQAKITGAKLRIDGSGGREFKQAFQTYLRRKLQEGQIDKFKFVDSKGDHLIQLADMLSGTIYRSFIPDKQDSSYLSIIRSRIENIWEYK